jgi:hypothetical protein
MGRVLLEQAESRAVFLSAALLRVSTGVASLMVNLYSAWACLKAMLFYLRRGRLDYASWYFGMVLVRTKINLEEWLAWKFWSGY